MMLSTAAKFKKKKKAFKKYLDHKRGVRDKMTGETMRKEAEKMQMSQFMKEQEQQKKEKQRLMEAESDVEARKAKMMRSRQYGRASLLGG